MPTYNQPFNRPASGSTVTPRSTTINRAITRPTSPTVPILNPRPSVIGGAVNRALSGTPFSGSATGGPLLGAPTRFTPPTPVQPLTPPGPNVTQQSQGTINPVSVNDLAGPVKTVVPPAYGPNPIQGQINAVSTADLQGPTKTMEDQKQFGDYAETGRNQFDLRRERVSADAAEEEKKRMASIERQLAASGIDDSGILQGQQRTEAANIRNAAGRAMTDVDISEDQNKLAERGMSLQEKSQSDSVKLAQSGLNLQASAQELQRQGMNQQDAQYYSGLGQAMYLAEKGLDQNAVAQELQRQGMSQQDAQFYAGLKAQKEGITQDIQKAIIVDQMTKIDPKDPQYLNKLQSLLSALTGLDSVIDSDIKPQPAQVATPSGFGTGDWRNFFR